MTRRGFLLALLGFACSRPETAGSGASKVVPTPGGGDHGLVAAPSAAPLNAHLGGPGPNASALSEPASPAAKTAILAPRPSTPRLEPISPAGTPRLEPISPAGTPRLEPITTSAPCELLAVGDSLTDPKSGGGGYLDGAKQACNCAVTNLGKGGDMVNQMRARMLQHLDGVQPRYRYVVIFGGVNDLYSDLTAKRSVEKIARDLEKMYHAAQAHGARTIAVTVAPWGGFRRYFTAHRWENTKRLNAWIRETPRLGLTDAVIDAESLLGCGDEEQLCADYARPYRDGLHFGPLGHRRLAAALVKSLGDLGCGEAPDGGSGSH